MGCLKKNFSYGLPALAADRILCIAPSPTERRRWQRWQGGSSGSEMHSTRALGGGAGGGVEPSSYCG